MDRRQALLAMGIGTLAFYQKQPIRLYSYSDLVQMDIPNNMRMQNWGGGSCVHASTYHLLKWQGKHELADWWRKTYSGGEHSSRLSQRLESANLKYAVTVNGDTDFLWWCMRTRRGAGITYWPNHAVNLVGLNTTNASILDNNRIGSYITVPTNDFIPNWKGYGGWAWTLVYDPPPPIPYRSGVFV